MTKNVRTTTTLGFWFCTVSAIGLFIASFFWPPCGQVDPSVIKSAGYCFAFASLFMGREAILEGIGLKLTHGSTTIELRDQTPGGEDPGQQNAEGHEDLD
ncbi:MAG: hypothetical protein K6A62_04740 [Bacteroidales bacterium]|nr:hypothetical protein [Bacteroidales bacterium]